MKNKKLFLSLFLFILFLIFILFLNFKEHLNVNEILNYYFEINAYIEKNFIQSVLIFIVSYSLLVLLNFPLVSLLSLSGGLFFGTIVGGILVTIGATLGAIIFFIMAKYFFYDFFKKKVLLHLVKFEYYFKKNEFSFLLFLRLVPALPFVVQNLIAACLGVNNIKFFWTTFLGIMPITFIITNIGSNTHEIILSGEEVSLHLIYQPQYIISISLLLLFIALGIFFKNKIN
ncbi:MAG: VTT domain-containing protein [Proteobacteria bacterium]|nr:VTT domain-containing protein [Pseudomonadota bacterium]